MMVPQTRDNDQVNKADIKIMMNNDSTLFAQWKEQLVNLCAEKGVDEFLFGEVPDHTMGDVMREPHKATDFERNNLKKLNRELHSRRAIAIGMIKKTCVEGGVAMGLVKRILLIPNKDCVFEAISKIQDHFNRRDLLTVLKVCRKIIEPISAATATDYVEQRYRVIELIEKMNFRLGVKTKYFRIPQSLKIVFACLIESSNITIKEI